MEKGPSFAQWQGEEIQAALHLLELKHRRKSCLGERGTVSSEVSEAGRLCSLGIQGASPGSMEILSPLGHFAYRQFPTARGALAFTPGSFSRHQPRCAIQSMKYQEIDGKGQGCSFHPCGGRRSSHDWQRESWALSGVHAGVAFTPRLPLRCGGRPGPSLFRGGPQLRVQPSSCAELPFRALREAS